LLEGQVLLRHVIEKLAAKSIGITIAHILVWLTYAVNRHGDTHEIMKLVVVEK
jgi:hypothetical protein